MKILLIQPALKNLRAIKKKHIIGSKIFRTPPLSLLMVAGATPEKYEVQIQDEHVEILDYDTDAEVIGITVNTCVSVRAYELSKFFREKGKKVILGGFHVTFNPLEAKKNADAIVLGEVENVWPRLLDDIEKNRLKKIYRGNNFKELSLPNARRDLVKNKGYYIINVIQATRGCPFKCDFCGINRFFKGTFRCRPVDEVISEIETMDSFRFLFTDDNIIGNPDYAKELFKKLIPLRKKWMGQASMNIAYDEELLELASKSGCIGLFLGFETINQKNIKDVKKNQNNVSKYSEIIKILHKHGISVAAGTMFGFDNDDSSIFKDSLNFFDKAGLDVMQIDPVTPFPGTPLYNKMKKQNRILSFNNEDYDIYKVVYKPKKMSAKELEDGLKYLRLNFYTFPKVIKRTINALFYGGFFCAYMVFIFNFGYWRNHRKNIGYPP